MQSYDELKRIKSLSAFSIVGAERQKVNQHMVRYKFSDGSMLQIYKAGHGVAFDRQGFGVCVSLLRVNAYGA